MSDILCKASVRVECGGLLHQPDPTVERLGANEGRAASPCQGLYAERFSIIQRFISLSEDGNKLDGEDIFLPATGGPEPGSP